MANPNLRRAVASSILVAAAIGSTLIATLKQDEGFTAAAVQPVPGDRWTYGHGSTFKLDGSPVRPGETITRERADKLLRKTVEDKYETGINRCAGDIEVLPREKGLMVELAYQNGVYGACHSQVVAKFRAGDYEGGCRAFLQLDTIKALPGVHCALPENRYRKDGCNGLMNRRERQYKSCMGAE